MTQLIKLKRSSTAGAVPSAASLALGEIAINTFENGAIDSSCCDECTNSWHQFDHDVIQVV